MKLRLSCLLVFIVVMMCVGLPACSSILKPPIIKAAETGEIDKVDQLIAEGVPVDTSNRAGVTPLFMAAANGHEDVVTRLIGKNADLNAAILKPFQFEDGVLAKGATPLMAALAGGHGKIADILMQNGAEVTVSDENGLTPLMLAASKCSPETVAACIKKGANVNAATTVDIVAKGRETVFSGTTALILALSNKKAENAAALIENGADIKAATGSNVSPLIAAAGAGDAKNLQFLIDSGVDVNLPDKNGTTALMAASAEGSLSAVEMLIAHGADVNARSTASYTVGKITVPKGWTALSGAAFAGHAEVVEFLIENGADVNAKDDDTHIDALFLASEAGHLEVANFLIASGANVYAETKMGTAFCVASHYGYPEIAEAIGEARQKLKDQEEAKTTDMTGTPAEHSFQTGPESEPAGDPAGE